MPFLLSLQVIREYTKIEISSPLELHRGEGSGNSIIPSDKAFNRATEDK